LNSLDTVTIITIIVAIGLFVWIVFPPPIPIFGYDEELEQFLYSICPDNFDETNMTDYYDCINGRDDSYYE
jgi:hypothetical protein